MENLDIFQEEESDDGIVFGKPEYWEGLYQNESIQADWYFDWDDFRSMVINYCKASDHVLTLGCGNSKLSEDMLKDGFEKIVNIDISPTVIQKMKEIYKNEHKLEWFEMDCAKLDFPDNSFDIIIDKGTYDSLLCGANKDSIIGRSCSEVFRVLKPKGYFFVISFSDPSLILPAMREFHHKWDLLPPKFIPRDSDPKVYLYTFEKH
ncbi:Phosphoethanolamine N-methyltransferase-related protein [Tritrichomonas foetus]|uniref:Phosphoethanolamine N-methyltransferase-related protein n=1 Tax=Tritrichomonas foetus TaxID=1144522 RepID=A0A1J4J3H4_9EUKA|nr:Phosphoethanolamine N-methyltransferase-related protein [Tritrichomonas foetus]|eukprot:OHS93289.1 Phosphoethanolamine N-methyltransferase-related protein [Tritrichomonas foetus]